LKRTSAFAKLYSVPRAGADQKHNDVLEAVDLTSGAAADQTLSGGMRRRLRLPVDWLQPGFLPRRAHTGSIRSRVSRLEMLDNLRKHAPHHAADTH